jgi:tRNA(Ile)-lysidine synthase
MDEKKWLLACSGGPDSMALAGMCLNEHLSFSIAMVNYHVRPEADEEEEYVRQFCQEHGIVCHVKNDPFAWTGNFEAAARRWRYDFFAALVKQYQYQGVLLAHHQDDLIETWLMQKEKGITPLWYGLKEESTYHGVIIHRPLLNWTKAELMQYCHDHGIRYYIDQTNLNGENERSRLRMEKAYTAEERKKILREIDAANAELRKIREKASALSDEKGLIKSGYEKEEKKVRLTALRQLIDPDQDRHLRDLYLGELDHIILQKDFLIHDHEKDIVTDGRHVWVQDPPEPYEYRYETLRYEEQKYYQISDQGRSTEAVTVKVEDYPLTIRNVRDGDAIHMFYGTKKVHRFFIDRHIPLYQRQTWPVVVSCRKEIILVPGLGCDRNHYSRNASFFVCVKR